MNRGRDTRAEILDIAEALLQERGFHGFSYQHIARQLGVKNAAIHYHFPSKPDLVEALVQRYRRRFQRWRERLHSDAESVDSCFDAYLEICRYFLKSRKICVLGMLAAEYNTMCEPVQAAIRDLQDELVDWFSELLERGQREQRISLAAKPRSKACALTAQLQGAMQFAQVRGEEAFEDVAQQVRIELFGEASKVADQRDGGGPWTRESPDS